MNASPRDAAETDSPSFEQALAELEKIVEELEEGRSTWPRGWRDTSKASSCWHAATASLKRRNERSNC